MYSTEACLTGFRGAQRDANTRMPDVPSTHRFAVLWYILVHASTYSVHTHTYLVCQASASKYFDIEAYFDIGGGKVPDASVLSMYTCIPRIMLLCCPYCIEEDHHDVALEDCWTARPQLFFSCHLRPTWKDGRLPLTGCHTTRSQSLSKMTH